MRRKISRRGHPRLRRIEPFASQTELQVLVHRLRTREGLAAPAPTWAPAPASRAPRLRRDRLARVPAVPEAAMRAPELEVLHVPAELLVQVGVLDDFLGRGDENLALTECEDREDDEDRPCYTHQDRHDGVPDVEEVGVEGVTDLAQGKDPTH